MIKAHRHSSAPMMRRSARVYLNELNRGKKNTFIEFLHLCHEVTQYFVDYFWQTQDFSSKLASLEVVHRGRDRFGITTRLAQALAKQVKEMVNSAYKRGGKKPRIRRHITTLYSHFVTIETFDGSFDFAIKFIGSGAPRIVVPMKSTKVINNRLKSDWSISKTIRLGYRKNKVFVDLILEKPRPAKKKFGTVVGLDSNYKNGCIFSNGQVVGQKIYPRIQTFGKRQKHTHEEVKSLVGQDLKHINFTNIRTLCIENLRNVKSKKRGKFPRKLNRRLSHWLYAYIVDLLGRHCEEHGVWLKRKNPWKTSQYCRICGKWDRRNRDGDRFCCIHCGFSNHADLNAAQNLALLGEAGVYGLRLLPSPIFCLQSQSFG